MVERKLYKTRICVLYKRGHCPRQTCSFAHGDAEIRRFSASFNGRRDYRGSDLRDKLGRRRSPPRRYSLDRDARDRHPSHGHSSPRSPGKRSDRKHRKKQQFDSESDFSGSLKMSDGTEDKVKDRKPTSLDSKDVHDKQLRQIQSEIVILADHKDQLELYLEERVQEADSLNSKIQELETQLCKEKEECKRISSKIRKFVKAHNRHSKIQDELKRSQARLQKLGDQLGSDATRSGANEEDTSINILSDEETFGNHVTSPRNEPLKNASPSKKRPRVHMTEADEESKQGEGLTTGKIRLDKHSRWDALLSQFNNSKEKGAEANGNNGCRPVVNEDKPRRGKSIFTSLPSADKLKDSELGLVLPPTGLAAHAMDEVIEVVEIDEKFDMEEIASSRGEKAAAREITGLPFPLPPPPPLPRNAYSQYKGKNEDVDVDGLDEMVDVDIV